MRLATLRTADGTATAAVADEDAWVGLPYGDVGALLAAPTGLATADEARSGADGRVIRADRRHERHIGRATGPADGIASPLPTGTTFGPVVPRPSKIICCGHNYAGHIREMGRALPSHPTLFTKFADTLTGPYDPVTVPAWAERLDWEAELAVVVGRGGAIAGYTAANDLSVRSWQHHTGQWLPGKAFDRTTPLGPVLVTADELDPGTGLDLLCRVNGETVQRGDTADLVFDAAALLAYVSSFTTLSPGDVLLTGTPAGVGAASDPPRSLRDGDVVEVEIASVGSLRTPIHIEERAEGVAA